MGQGPIFIAGLSYSGKTQLRLMLNAHANIVITRRTYMWRRYYNRFGDLQDAENLQRCLTSMLASKHIKSLNPDPARITHEFLKGQPDYGRLFAIIHRHYAEGRGKKRWGVQYGGLENDARLIYSMYPDALILHMVRSPFERLEESIATSSHRKAKLGWETSLWRRSAQLAGRNLEKYPGRYQVVTFEDLFDNPELALGKICTFLGETYQPDMLEVEGLVEMGVNIPTAAGTPASVQLSLRPSEQSFIQSMAKQEMALLGYPKADLGLSLSNIIHYALVEYPVNFAGALLWQTWGRRKFPPQNYL